MPAKTKQKPSPATTSDPGKPITTAPHQPKYVRGALTVHLQFVLTLSKRKDTTWKLFGNGSKDDATDLFPSGASGVRSNFVPLLLAPILLCVLLYAFVNFGVHMTTTGQITEPSTLHKVFCVVLDMAHTFGIDVDDEQNVSRCEGGPSTSTPPSKER